MGAMHIIHYTSADLKNWTFAEVARSAPVAYDSDVFRIGDGRWIMFSTEQDRPTPAGTPKPLQSRTLYNWTECDDPGLQINVRAALFVPCLACSPTNNMHCNLQPNHAEPSQPTTTTTPTEAPTD
jgi:hypothetical protein